MPNSNNYQSRLFIFLAMALFPSVKVAVSADVPSQSTTNPGVAHVPPSSGEIPVGFKTDRYAKVWERNPFTLVTPSSTQPPQSPFDKLFLTSWLKEGHKDVVFIQNLETNEVQKITAEPNQQHLRLVSLHVGASPQLVEALVSNGQEQGTLKFRIDPQSLAGQTNLPVGQITNAGSPRAVQTVSAQSSTQVNSTNVQTSSLPANIGNQSFTRGAGSGTSNVSMGADPRQIPRRRHGSEGVTLSLPQKSG